MCAAWRGTEVVRAAVLGELRRRDRWLLVFDNAQDPEDLEAWLPGGTGHVLVTSRAPRWAEVAVPVEVDVLDRSESMALLRDRVPGLPEADADQMAGAVGDLPLALAQAAAYLTETRMPAGQYAGLLGTRAAQLMGEGRPPSYPRPLAAVTVLALDRLRGQTRPQLSSPGCARSWPPSRCPRTGSQPRCCPRRWPGRLRTRWPGGRCWPRWAAARWPASTPPGW